MRSMLPVWQPGTTMSTTEPFAEHTSGYDAWFDRHQDLYRAELAAIRIRAKKMMGRITHEGRNNPLSTD